MALIFGRGRSLRSNSPGVIWFSLSQVQQATRRALLASLSDKKATAGDIVAYMGQVFVVVLIANSGKVSLINSLYGMALLLGLGALLQAVQLKLFTKGCNRPVAGCRGDDDCRSFGRSVSGSGGR